MHPSQSYQAIAKEYDKHHGLSQNASNSHPLENNGSDTGTAIGACSVPLEKNTESSIESCPVNSHDPGYIDDGYGVDYANESNHQEISFGINDGYGVEDSAANTHQESGLSTSNDFGTDDYIRLSNHNIDTSSCPGSCSNEESTSNSMNIG